jgi:putative transposase
MFPDRPRRLDGVSYTGYERYFLTSCTANRHRAFKDEATAHFGISQLRNSAALHAFAIAAYCFMPDHVHLLVYGTALDADLPAFVAHFKKLTGYEYKQRTGRRLWQPGYYDHILRGDEATEVVAKYTFENPLRAGLTKVFGEYPYAGSDLFDCKQL